MPKTALTSDGGALKLDVEDGNAGILHLLDNGQAELGTVSDVLTRPSDLKKGAAYHQQAAAELMVVDRMTHAAAYFPRAFGIETFARPDAGASVLLMALDYVSPALTGAVASALSEVPSEKGMRVLAALRPMLYPPFPTKTGPLSGANRRTMPAGSVHRHVSPGDSQAGSGRHHDLGTSAGDAAPCSRDGRGRRLEGPRRLPDGTRMVLSPGWAADAEMLGRVSRPVRCSVFTEHRHVT